MYVNLLTLPFIFFQDVSQGAIAEKAAPEKEVLTTKALIIIITGKCTCIKKVLNFVKKLMPLQRKTQIK